MRFAPGISRHHYALLVAIALSLVAVLAFFPTRASSPLATLERFSFDVQMRFLRAYYPRAASVDPVLIGMDEGSETAFNEPLALWHRHYAKTLDALVIAKPKLVGMDVVLPDRSFDWLVPGLDLPLTRSLFQLAGNTKVVLVNTLDSKGAWVPLHTPFRRFMGEANFGLDQVLKDPDGVARQFDEARVGTTFSGQIVRTLGGNLSAGYIDYSVGAALPYVSMQQVVALRDANNEAELTKLFGGKIVLIGSMQKDRDRWRLPVRLAPASVSGGEDLLEQPGVIIHVQTLRSLLGAGLIKPIAPIAALALVFGVVLLVGLRWRRAFFLVVFVGLPVCFYAVSLLLITANTLLPAATLTVTLWAALAVRVVWDALQTVLEKERLKQSFAGSVSPAVLDEMMAGKLSTGVSAETAEVCVLFSDIRGFTGLAESLTPEMVTSVLTRYFDRMVDCVHRNNGTLDKFMGDGMMVLFGAPRPVANPCQDAVRCALEMMQGLAALNAEFAAEGVPPLGIGIGINFGKVVVGNIGSTQRHNYSAIGDAVNVASRIEGLTKRLGKPIVMTAAVVDKLPAGTALIAFGEQDIRGHSALALWGVELLPELSPHKN